MVTRKQSGGPITKYSFLFLIMYTCVSIGMRTGKKSDALELRLQVAVSPTTWVLETFELSARTVYKYTRFCFVLFSQTRFLCVVLAGLEHRDIPASAS